MIYELDSKYLSNKLETFDFSDPPMDPVELAHILAKSMLDKEGLGLAANQIGLPYRVFAINANPILVCFNPRIVDKSDDTAILEEGCLSYPGLLVKVKRSNRIKVRYTEPNGNTVTKTFEGMTARIFQHEFSHMEGKTFLDDCSYIERERAKKRLRKK